MSVKVCVFAGHRRLMHSIEDELRVEIRRLIAEDGVNEFWSGGMGDFDALCARVVREMKREYPHVRLVLVLASMSKSAMHMEWARDAYDGIIVAGASDGAHYKQAITLRNRWMAQQCSVMLAYVQRDHGGAYAAARYAARIRKPLRFIRENPELAQRFVF